MSASLVVMRGYLEALLSGRALSTDEAQALLTGLTDTELPPALAGALLAALRAKGVTPEELRGFALGMRALAHRPSFAHTPGSVDIVGTGGDKSGSFNLSTGASLLAAAAGLTVIKHGNRSISSKAGSADVLEALGLPLPLDEARAAKCLAEANFTFLFAPHYHPAMKAIGPVRTAMGVRTVFNILGPLTNPAEPPFHVIGAYNEPTARLMAQAISGMPIERAFVLHGAAGWDEPTPLGPFLLLDVRPGQVRESRRTPADYGIEVCAEDALLGGDAAFNAAALTEVMRGRDHGPHRDALCLGAALALEVTGHAPDPRSAIAQARAAIDDGRATALMDRMAVISEALA